MSNPDYRRLLINALEKNVDNPKWKEGDFIGIKTVSNTNLGRTLPACERIGKRSTGRYF